MWTGSYMHVWVQLECHTLINLGGLCLHTEKEHMSFIDLLMHD